MKFPPMQQNNRVVNPAVCFALKLRYVDDWWCPCFMVCSSVNFLLPLSDTMFYWLLLSLYRQAQQSPPIYLPIYLVMSHKNTDGDWIHLSFLLCYDVHHIQQGQKADLLK